jgi:predicted RNA-binding Zn-ribbon protein involved in translation (DUF1610 family)/uncharacterized integral membrane protein
MATQSAICPHCGAPTFGMSFCTSCGARLAPTATQVPPICPQCGAPNLGMQFCTNCGTRLARIPTPQAPTTRHAVAAAPTAKAKVARKYGALRALATVCRIIGWLILVGGSLISIAAAVLIAAGTTLVEQQLPQISTWGMGALATAIGGIILSVLYGLLALAFADLCWVLMDIEANTRQQAESIAGQAPLS